MDYNDESNVTMDDILSSMSFTLLKQKAVVKSINIPDRVVVKPIIGGKPPKEIFYRKALVQKVKPPKSHSVERCSNVYLCLGAKATLKCLSCALYDLKGLGYYCDLCFKARHPWYRVTHICIPIYQNESIALSMSKQTSQLEADRERLDTYKTLETIKKDKERLVLLADDLAVDNNIRTAARKSVQLTSSLLVLKRKLRKQIRGNGGELTWDEDEACTVMQRCFRGYKVRKVISLSFLKRIIKVFDPSTGRDFYYDTALGTSSWTVPQTILKHHWGSIPQYKEKEDRPDVWVAKRNGLRRRRCALHMIEAALVIAGFMRCILSRKRVIQRANAVYCRVWDEQDAAYFYANVITGETMWSKPKVFLLSDAPILQRAIAACSSSTVSEAASKQSSQVSSKSSKGSNNNFRTNPLMNREKIRKT